MENADLLFRLEKAEARALAGAAALVVLHEIRNPLEALGHLIYLASHQVEAPRVRLYLE